MSSRSAVNDPRMPTIPIASGRLAAARLPKITSSRISRIGSDSPSARPMLELTWVLIADSVGMTPPTWVVSPGADSELLIAL